MTPFWPLEHTADIGLLIRGRDLPELIVEGCKGLVLLLTGEYTVRPNLWRTVEVEGPEPEILLADFMSEVLSLATLEGLLAVKVEPEMVDETKVKAEVGLVAVDRKVGLKTEIKAITYHGLEIRETDSGLEAEVVMDV